MFWNGVILIGIAIVVIFTIIGILIGEENSDRKYETLLDSYENKMVEMQCQYNDLLNKYHKLVR